MLSQQELAKLSCPHPGEISGYWPWSLTRNEEGELTFPTATVSELAQTYGTPLFVVDEDDLAGKAEVWISAMSEACWDGYGMNGATVSYAAKAFMCGSIVKLMNQHGLSIDTASLAELECAIRAGAKPEQIGLHGNAKSDAELRRAVDFGIDHIFVDSPAEAERISQIAAELGKVARVMIRVTTGVHAGGHEFIATAHEDQKFGVSLATGAAFDLGQKISNDPNLDFRGLHSHIGSQINSLEAFEQGALKLLGLRSQFLAAGIDIPTLDLGGGYPIRYLPTDPQPLTPREIADTLAKTVREYCQSRNEDIPHLQVEPGRSLAGPTAITLYRVVGIKRVTIAEGQYRDYVAVDGGMSDNIRPALYGANYTALLANRVGSSELTYARVVGKHCESGDILIPEIALPADLKPGDILAMPATGAYGRSMASNYNMALKPGVVAASRDGVKVWLRPETITDLFALDPALAEVEK
ncbi:diaminopimelate decarboxylase [Boudabousia tangfeifanii]|uniref:Diaminopimelate decarboxylase n=1 Tax=Boudabousia tangfeifanii TaxID=1912795 RepID=A0A1D9MJH0_9ACTO|nr:diaminopimelate decarboxylase [Boudabousia tangfeifanii]AOZ72491.1 diaminopimelate decarboxylase [Boudabousia tangfeifanii]